LKGGLGPRIFCTFVGDITTSPHSLLQVIEHSNPSHGCHFVTALQCATALDETKAKLNASSQHQQEVNRLMKDFDVDISRERGLGRKCGGYAAVFKCYVLRQEMLWGN